MLKVQAGEALRFTLVNPDVVPHNWLLIKPGTLERIGDLANRLVAEPDAVTRQYVPRSDDVLLYTDVVPPGESFTIYFRAKRPLPLPLWLPRPLDVHERTDDRRGAAVRHRSLRSRLSPSLRPTFQEKMDESALHQGMTGCLLPAIPLPLRAARKPAKRPSLPLAFCA